MRTKLMATLAVSLATASLAAAPIAAEAASTHTKRVLVCNGKVTKKANQGTALGAVAGGVLGNVVAGHGNKTEGTLLGAGVGAVVGHQVAKNKARKNCHYEYVKVRSRRG